MSEPVSPLAFTRAYQTYRAEAAAIPFADTRLLLAARFWTGHADALGDPLYETFWREDLPLILRTVSGMSLDDLLPDELEEVAAFVDRVAELFPDITTDARPIREKAAEVWFYVGEWKRALAALAEGDVDKEVGGAHPTSSDSVPSRRVGSAHQPLEDQPPVGAARERPAPSPGPAGASRSAPTGSNVGQEPCAPDSHREDTCRERGAPDLRTSIDAEALPSLLAEQLEQSRPETARWLREFDARWQAKRESGDPRRAHCLLVEYDTRGLPVRGRLRTLEGKIERLDAGAHHGRLGGDVGTDEVIFHHQVASPDDPFVGSAYGALAALRQVTNRRRVFPHPDPLPEGEGDRKPFPPGEVDPAVAGSGEGRRGANETVRAGGHPAVATAPHFRARFGLSGQGDEVYTGESIGLAAFAVAYGDSWAGEIHRERRLIGDTVAFTGGINAAGEVQPVSADSLALKIKRAFWSPLEYVAVPEANRRDAEAAVDHLRHLHPLRRLRVIGIERPADVIADHNILRPEKVCLGEFAVRKAARLSRSVKVQVPVLLATLYVLLCLVYPKAWVGFDWNPARLQASSSGIRVVNARGQELWARSFPCPCIDTASDWIMDDIDGDGRRELAYLLGTPKSDPCSLNATVFVLDHNGDQLFHQSAVILGEYPGDSSLLHWYTAGQVDVFDFRQTKRIMTWVTSSYPARAHIRFWSPRGEPKGWYINAGFPGIDIRQRVVLQDAGVVCLAGYNNRMDRAAAFYALPIDSSSGCSPPYVDTEYDLPWVRRGNQSAYLVFPRTDLSHALGQPYSSPTDLRPGPGGIIISVDEGGQAGHAEIWYTLDSCFHVRGVDADDYFWTYRDKFVDVGILPAVDRSAYLAALRDSVRYWTDSGWVTEGQLRAFEKGR